MRKTLLSACFLISVLSSAWAQPERMLERMTSELNLTTTQVEQVRTLLKDRPSGPPPGASSSSAGQGRPSGPPPGGGKFESELKKTLTAEQWAKFEQIRAQHRPPQQS
jgi:hypothetical protein